MEMRKRSLIYIRKSSFKYLFIIFVTSVLAFKFLGVLKHQRMGQLKYYRAESCDYTYSNTSTPAIVTNSTMIAMFVLDCQPGYMKFTSPLLPLTGNRGPVHVFAGRHSCQTKNDFMKYYGNDVVLHKVGRNKALLETVREAIEYFFVHVDDFEHLILATPDVLFTESAYSAFTQHPKDVDLLQSMRTESGCDPAISKISSEEIPRVIGSQMSKSFIRLLRQNPVLLQYCGKRDVTVAKVSQMKIFSPKESFSIRIGQEFENNKSSRYVETINFNRCKLPIDLRTGVEFYLEKCNRPHVYFDANLSLTESSTRSSVMYSKPAISFSLYGGNNSRYIDGALENSELVRTVFPEWRMWVFHDDTVPCNVLHTLCSRGVKLVKLNDRIENRMAWRFAIASEPVERFLIRDIDSRLSLRESEAVKEWIISGKKFHSIRDHPCHSNFAMNGGLWGATRDAIPNMLQLMEAQRMKEHYLQDMDFLNSVVWPIAQKSVYQHDSFPNGKFGEVHPIPIKRTGTEHIGNVLIEGSYRPADLRILVKALENPNDARC